MIPETIHNLCRAVEAAERHSDMRLLAAAANELWWEATLCLENAAETWQLPALHPTKTTLLHVHAHD